MRVIFIALSGVIISITSATAISFTVMCGNNIILFSPFLLFTPLKIRANARNFNAFFVPDEMLNDYPQSVHLA